MIAKQRGNILLTVVLALLAALAAALIVMRMDNDSGATEATVRQTVDDVERLQLALDAGQLERSRLADSMSELAMQVDELHGEVDYLQASLEEAQLAAGATDSFNEPVVAPPPPVIDQGAFEGRANRRPDRQQAIEALVVAGVDEQTAQGIQTRGDQYQLARLELLDQATREGWADSERLQEQLTALDEERVDLRAELGDSRYDHYLYEAGQPNRVEIAAVISGSAADRAGLAVGDLIVRYANDLVFRPRELQDATRSGIRGEYVQMELDRGGQSLSADIPRGPLGVTLSRTRIEP